MSVGTNSIGKPVSRIDGPAKVTGRAKYAAEFSAPDLAYGFVVSSVVAKGRIKSIDRSAALAVPGVIEVFAHDNRPSLPSSHEKYTDKFQSPFRPFVTVRFTRTTRCAVVAEELEIAAFAASLVDIRYETEEAVTDPEKINA
jgi:xanthine dehydrogenase YagR molybdenum-binding subunit